ncbi:MAG: hypothetical protein K0S76_1647 [Herbinix sp.]|jgi:glycosyltransferase involved in cell wall biosynthesis|nr:hypothetical protein [Herbinix sp.]
MPFISIIIPVYNSEKYLNNCIESVLQQTLTEIEIILIDDGSVDNSFRICEEYSKRDKRIILIHQHNKGQSVARNIGLKLASGSYIFFLDSDDRLYQPDTLENMYKKAKKIQCDLLIGQFYCENKENHLEEYFDETKLISGREALITLLKDKKFQGVVCSNLYERKLFIHHGLLFKEGYILEDEELSPKLFYYADRVGVFKNFSYYRTKNENSTTQSETETAIFKRIRGLIMVSASLWNFFVNGDHSTEEEKQIMNRRAVIFYLMAALSSYKIKKQNYIQRTEIELINSNILKKMKIFDIKTGILYWVVKIFGKKTVIRLLRNIGRITKF